MLRRLVGVGFVLIVVGWAKSALADDWADCIQRAKPDLIVRACTLVIESGEAIGEKLAQAYDHRGIGHYVAGDYDLAIADYNSAIEITPDYAIAHYNLGAAHIARGDPQKAVAEFRIASRLLPPNNPWSRLALAHIEELESPRRSDLRADENDTEEYRVHDVAEFSALNMRSGPGTTFPVVREIPPTGSGILVGACRVVEGYRAKWCQVSWRNSSGWASACCLVSERTGAVPD